ncbi:probable sarcosine oxidase [Telopea speciosissima]|uniref:probable sarcosine oxidase n=1 Tax=Telopea speciosissima TaxID=54955 RepID=UPI001CC7386D|nr:probable sarcosine oxidase [Telopea speciosissima]XP_043712232.1 probable sarcosine oxidase [Telopea speciosissima]
MENSGDQFDVIIVGAGIMGSCTAYQAAKRGRKVLLLEQFDFLHHRGSSHGESRTIRATYPEHYYSSMVIESSHLWEEAQSEIGYRVYFKTPHFDVGPADDKSLQSVITSCQAKSIPHCILDRRQVAEKFSGKFNLPENWIGLWTELGGVIKPTKAVSMFQTLAIQRGAVLRDYMEVKEIKRDDVKGDILVITSNGDKYWGNKCVVTAGAWTKKLVETVSGLEVPIQPLNTTVQYWRIKEGSEKDYSLTGGFPTFAGYGDPYIYGTPSLEFPGLIKIAVHGGYPCDPDKRSWVPVLITNPVNDWIEGKFCGLVESSKPVITQSCMYSMTPDGDFVIDFLGGDFGRDVVVAGGFSGHGFKMGPVVGRILADLVLDGEAQGVELSHFRLGRFEENPKGNLKEFDDQVCPYLQPSE